MDNNLIRIIKLYLKKDYKEIDLEIVLFAIKSLLKGNIDLFTEEELETIIKSFCFKNISKYFTDYEVKIINSDEINSLSKLNDVIGLVKDKTLYLERETLEELKTGDLEVFRVIFHEVWHIQQRYIMNNNVISYRNYLNVLEQIIILELDDEYYKENYRYFFDEIDARFQAECHLYDFINNIAPDLIHLVFDECLENVLKCEKEIECTTRIYKGKEYEKEALFDKIIKRKPIYATLYPLLSFYYNEDGSKIPVSDILLRSKYEACNSDDDFLAQQVKRLDSFILQNRKGTKQNIEKDIASLKCLSTDDIELDKKRLELLKQLENCLTTNNSGNNINTMYDSVLNKVNLLRLKINM